MSGPTDAPAGYPPGSRPDVPEGTATGPAPGARTRGTHPVHVPHLVLGIAFTGVALVWLLRAGGAVGHDDLRWVLPIPWVAAGLAGLLAATLSGGRRHEQQVTGWVGDQLPREGTCEPASRRTSEPESVSEPASESGGAPDSPDPTRPLRPTSEEDA